MVIRDDRKDGGISILRLFVVTAVVAVVFSIGLILGQRLLVEDGLGPAVDTHDDRGSAVQIDEQDTSDHQPPGDDEESIDLYSFYDALTDGEAVWGDDASIRVGEPNGAGDQPASDEHSGDDNEHSPARYTLRVATHNTLQQARGKMDRLSNLQLEFEPQLVTEQAPEGDAIYEVRLGRFPTEDQARAFANRLENRHDLQGWVSPL